MNQFKIKPFFPFKFDVDDVSGELDSNRPVPFRLTPNVYEFISEVGVRGPLTASMISAARCLVHPNFKVQAILRYVASGILGLKWSSRPQLVLFGPLCTHTKTHLHIENRHIRIVR